MNSLKIGKNLQEILDFLDINQKQFSEKTGLSQPHVSLILKGDRGITVDTLARILDLIPVTFERLTR